MEEKDGNGVKKLRAFLNLSQQDFAVLVGVSIRSVAGWEAGTTNPTGLSAKKLQEIKEKFQPKI